MPHSSAESLPAPDRFCSSSFVVKIPTLLRFEVMEKVSELWFNDVLS